MKTCRCNMRTKLVGDGCVICNPEYLHDKLIEDLGDLEEWDDEDYARILCAGASMARNGRQDLGLSLRDAIDAHKVKYSPEPDLVPLRRQFSSLDMYRNELMK